MKKNDFYRVIPPKVDFGDLNFRHLQPLQKNSDIRPGDVRILPGRNQGSESLWLLVLSLDDSEGTARVCMLHYDVLLAADTDVILNVEQKNRDSRIVVWPSVLGNLVQDDYLTTSFFVANVGDTALEDVSNFINNLESFDLDRSSYLVRPSNVLCETLNVRLYKRTLINQLLDYSLRSWNLVNTLFISDAAIDGYEISELEKLIDEGAFFLRLERNEPRSKARVAALLRSPRISSTIFRKGGGFQIPSYITENKEDFFEKLLREIGSDFTYISPSSEDAPALYFEIAGQRIREVDRRLSEV